MQYKHMRFVSSFFVVLFLSACAGGYSAKTAPFADQAAQKKTDKRNDALILNATVKQGTLADTYLIGPEDVLEIEAYNVEELKKTVRVNSHGDIALPLVGILSVKGLTTAEVEKLIAGKLQKYVQETAVNVFIKEYKSQRISVVGAVNKSQVFAVTGQRYLVDMLMLAEGVSKDAGGICYVIRPAGNTGSDSERGTTIVIDLDELLVNGNLSLNIAVFAGDVINVPKGGTFFVDGSVRTPGPYTMKGKTTLSQAISMAQGVSSDAALSDVRIFREKDGGDREVIQVDFDAVNQGALHDVAIVENDIIIVPQSGMKNFFNGFVGFLKGFVSFGGSIIK